MQKRKRVGESAYTEPVSPTASAKTAVVLPCPQPISSTRWPGPMPHRLISVMRCSACAISMSGAEGGVIEYEAILPAMEAGMVFSVMFAAEVFVHSFN